MNFCWMMWTVARAMTVMRASVATELHRLTTAVTAATTKATPTVAALTTTKAGPPQVANNFHTICQSHTHHFHPHHHHLLMQRRRRQRRQQRRSQRRAAISRQRHHRMDSAMHRPPRYPYLPVHRILRAASPSPSPSLVYSISPPTSTSPPFATTSTPFCLTPSLSPLFSLLLCLPSC